MKEYIFFREDGFYSIGLIDDLDAIENAMHNVGTIKVEDIEGNIIWEQH